MIPAPIDILAIASAMLATIGAVYSLRKLISGRKAERSLRNRLVGQRRERLLTLLQQLRQSDAQAYERALKLIEGELQSMSSADRSEIFQGLKQPTMRGRRAYVESVLQKTADLRETMSR